MSSKAYFDDVAGQWDGLRRSFFSDDVREQAIAAARVEPDGTAADLGAGTGFITEGLVARGVKVIAVDQSEAMLDAMRAKFAGRGQIDYRAGEAERLPIADAGVDYVFANMYLHHVESPAAAIREMARILKPGGRLVITDLDEHAFEFLRAEQYDRWMGFKREDVKAWLSEAGLVAEVACAGSNCCADSKSGGERADVSIFVASGVKATGQAMVNPMASTGGCCSNQRAAPDSAATASGFIPVMDIHEGVREHYAGLAANLVEGRSSSACCSSKSECSYLDADVSQLPADVAEASWGCGDPISLAALQTGQRVLDLGSGGGLDCILAARRVGETGWVIGVDMTPEMLSLAWRNVAKVGLRNVEFRYGHIEQLPVESGTIDVILSNCVINLSPDKPAVFREAYRVLKAGGKFAVSDIVSDKPIPEQARADMDSLAACVSGAWVEGDYLAAIQSAGFEEVRVVDRKLFAPVPGSDVMTYSVRVEAYKLPQPGWVHPIFDRLE